MDYGTSAQFVSSLVKSLQALCNGYVEFDTWVQVRGQLYLNTDTGKTIEFVIDEKVCKTNEYSVSYTSNRSMAPRAERYETIPVQQSTPTQQYVRQEVIPDFETSIFEPLEPPGNIHDLVNAARHTEPNFQYQYTTGADAYQQQSPPKQTQPQIQQVLQVKKPHLPIAIKAEGGATYAEVTPYEKPKIIKRYEPMGDGPHKCELCGKGFTRESNLKIHRRLHTGDKPYECDICGSRHNTTRDLKVHKRVHTGEKPYKCGICGKSFAQYGTLKRHKITHTKGEREHVCDVCNKGFDRKDYLQWHKRIHEADRMNKCRICDIVFNSKEELQEHKETHRKSRIRTSDGEERVFQCDMCEKTFDRKHKLLKHKKLHMAESSTTCKICGETFENKLMLLIHKNKHTAQKLTIVVKKKLPNSDDMET